VKAVWEKIKDIAYPPSCLLCEQFLGGKKEKLCCKDCLEGLELLDPKERCPRCFGWGLEGEVCPSCTDHPPLFYRLGAAFSYEGSAAGLVRQFKYGNRPYLAKSLAAYLAVQMVRMGWEPPDLLVPVPMSWVRKLLRGYNQSALLAQELEQYGMGKAVPCLKRREGGAPQASLSSWQRRQLDTEIFSCTDPQKVAGKRVCLIDDVYTTGSTLSACAEVLLASGADEVSALTLCRV